MTRRGQSAGIIVSEERWNQVTQKVPPLDRRLAEYALEPADLRERPARLFRSDSAE